MDHTLTKISRDIETIAVKARYYQRYANYRKSEDDTKTNLNSFLNQVIKQDIATLEKLELDLTSWYQHAKTNPLEMDLLPSDHLHTLIEESLTIYRHLLSE